MIRIIIGMSVMFSLLAAIIVATSMRRVYRNIDSYIHWRSMERGARVKMALWASIPLLLLGLFWMSAIGLWGFLFGRDLGIAQSLAYLPLGITALALGLWWRFDQSFGERGSRLWCWLMWGGIGLSGAVILASWWIT